MAATMRPSVLRHRSLFAPAKRVFTTNSAIPHSVRAASIPSLIARRPLPVGSTVPKDTIQGSLRVAVFHASAKKAILPQGPRMSSLSPASRDVVLITLKEVIRGTGTPRLINAEFNPVSLDYNADIVRSQRCSQGPRTTSYRR